MSMTEQDRKFLEDAQRKMLDAVRLVVKGNQDAIAILANQYAELQERIVILQWDVNKLTGGNKVKPKF